MINVILVDYRAIDTLGEVFVLAVAAIGVFTLLTIRPSRSGGHAMNSVIFQVAARCCCRSCCCCPLFLLRATTSPAAGSSVVSSRRPGTSCTRSRSTCREPPAARIRAR